MRGFGVDIPEEEEPEEEVAQPEQDETENANEDEAQADTAGDDSREETERGGEREDTDQDEVSTVAQSRIHSRHVSKLSAALSLVSVGRTDDPVTLGEPPVEELEQMEEMDMPTPVTMPVAAPVPAEVSPVEVEEADADAVEEWTGSEDLRTGQETSDDEVRPWLF